MSSPPLPDRRCPLCDGPNGCLPARGGAFDRPCWCEATAVPPSLIDRVEPALRGKACICAGCVQAHAGATTEADSPCP